MDKRMEALTFAERRKAPAFTAINDLRSRTPHKRNLNLVQDRKVDANDKPDPKRAAGVSKTVSTNEERWPCGDDTCDEVLMVSRALFVRF